jgi:hypothetical protein
MAQSQKYTAHTAQRRHRQRYTVQVVARGAAGINQEEQTESLPWETENLVALLEKMMDNGVKVQVYICAYERACMCVHVCV